jgi:homoserine O-succinyltransferase/O-acetyltransferase
MVMLPLSPTPRDLPRSENTPPIRIGLVNNMPDAALGGTERQFRELLESAAGNLPIMLRIFSATSLPRSDAGWLHVRENHENLDALWEADLDGLIVTGTEPRATDIADELCWPILRQLVDWAAKRELPSIWSCLAAHAAVQYLDSVERRRRITKLSGVFDCIRTADHALLSNVPARWCMPHSRFNELQEGALAAAGYQILARAAGAGADLFVKRCPSLFVFMQGHPEYDARCLLREYRRDVGRFLAGAVDHYPELPCAYFDQAGTDALLTFRERSVRERNADLMAHFPAEATRNLASPWRPAAIGIYAGWLSYLVEERALRRRSVEGWNATVAGPVGEPAYG